MALTSLLFANNAQTTLAASATSTQLTLQVSAGSGVLFPSPGANEYFTITLNDASTGLLYEVCYCTAVVGDVLTVLRGQEGTIGLSWATGDICFNGITAGTAAEFAQVSQVQAAEYNYALDTGSANSYYITLDPAPISVYAGSMPVGFTALHANTGASTLTVNGTTFPLVGRTYQPLLANQIQAGSLCRCVYVSAVSSYVLVDATGGVVPCLTASAGTSDISQASTAFVGNSRYGFVAIPITSTTQTLTAAQYGTGIIRFTGTLTGDTSVTVPDYFSGLVENATSGSHNLTLKIAAGSGFIVPQNSLPLWVVADGSSVTCPDLNSEFTPLGTIAPPAAIRAGTVSSNALTVGIPAQTITFRNSSLTSGTPVTLSVGALTLTIPIGATLGMTSGVEGGIALLCFYNGGSPVLGVVNINTVLPLTEDNLSSTVAISSSATSADTFYTASVVTNSPYRVMGVYYVTESIAGVYTTAPSRCEGVGGLAFSSVQVPGVCQNYVDQTANRSLGVGYRNTSARPKTVIVVANSASSTATSGTFGFHVGTAPNIFSQPNFIRSNTYIGGTGTFIVPPFSDYEVYQASGSFTVLSWTELG